MLFVHPGDHELSHSRHVRQDRGKLWNVFAEVGATLYISRVLFSDRNEQIGFPWRQVLRPPHMLDR
jgi:hypothetical protein